MRFFENAYEGTPTWDIGRPQGAVVRLARSGRLAGRVVDLGCGTGDQALYLAGLGCEVTGIDFAAAAVARARAKAAERGLAAEFVVADALNLAELGRLFDVALDIGLFHTLQPEERVSYARQVRLALRPGGRCFVLAWSDRNPFGRGPERIGRRDLRRAFRPGWLIESIVEETLETRLPEGAVHAWLASLRRS